MTKQRSKLAFQGREKKKKLSELKFTYSQNPNILLRLFLILHIDISSRHIYWLQVQSEHKSSTWVTVPSFALFNMQNAEEMILLLVEGDVLDIGMQLC